MKQHALVGIAVGAVTLICFLTMHVPSYAEKAEEPSRAFAMVHNGSGSNDGYVVASSEALLGISHDEDSSNTNWTLDLLAQNSGDASSSGSAVPAPEASPAPLTIRPHVTKQFISPNVCAVGVPCTCVYTKCCTSCPNGPFCGSDGYPVCP